MYERCFADDLAIRTASANELLAVLASVTNDDARLNFLIMLAGYNCLEVPLGASFRQLSLHYPRAEEDVRSLVQTSVAMADDAKFRGIILAAGHLELSDAATVEALGNLLMNPRVSAAVRESLQLLTRREFAHKQEFLAWWKTHQYAKRNAWILEAADAALLREFSLWVARLEGHSLPDALAAIAEPRTAIRRLGYLAMRDRTPPDSPEATASVVEALEQAFQKEQAADLRLELLLLIPRFLSGQGAIALLGQAMDSSDSSEQEQAVQALHFVSEKAQVRKLLWKHLQQIYGRAGYQNEQPNYRRLLFGALEGIGPESNPDLESSTAQDFIEPILATALDHEQDAEVRKKVYAIAGMFGGLAFRERLLLDLLPEEHTEADRLAALDALVRIALDAEQPDSLVPQLSSMLSDPQEGIRYRALKAVRRLDSSACVALIPPRLGFEESTSCRNEMLVILASAEAVGALEALLSFHPTIDEHESWGGALLQQIGTDFAGLELAVKSLHLSSDWGMAYQLLEKPAQADWSKEQALELKRLQARTMAQWLIHQGNPKEREERIPESLDRLQECLDAEPTEAEWPMLMGRLHGLSHAFDEAFASFQVALALGLPDADRWPVAIYALDAALAATNRQGGLTLCTTLGEPPKAFAAAFESLQTSLESLDP